MKLSESSILTLLLQDYSNFTWIKHLKNNIRKHTHSKCLMKVFLLYILNKAGGLIYQADINPGLAKLNANDYLVLAGTLHGMHAIGSRLSQSFSVKQKSINLNNLTSNNSIIQSGKALDPNCNRTGLRLVETAAFNLYVFQSVTGLKFVLITLPRQALNTTHASAQESSSKSCYAIADNLFRDIYVTYSHFAMKDPFYSLDMPIKSILFNDKVRKICE